MTGSARRPTFAPLRVGDCSVRLEDDPVRQRSVSAITIEANRAGPIGRLPGGDGAQREEGREALLRQGTANGKTISVRAIAWIIAGHELHHRGILIERYGLGG